MWLCQRRQPPKAVAAGQRLQGRILAATIGRGARGAALFKGNVAGSRSACSGRNLPRVVSSVCRATAWRRAGLEDEGLAAQPLTSLLICGARALLDSAAALPVADEALVSLFGMPGKFDFRITQRFDIISVGSSALVALSRRLPGLQLHRAQFAGDQGRACPLVIGALGQQMPAEDGELACHCDCRDLMAATGADTQEERAQWAWRLGRGPCGQTSMARA